MVFNNIIMNPPYERELHLKILENAINFLFDKNSSCVNLSPCRWLQDPFRTYKNKGNKYQSITSNLDFLKIISAKESFNQFGIEAPNLGIYHIRKDLENKYVYKGEYYSIISKITEYCWNNKVPIEEKEKDGWRVRYPIISDKLSYGHGAERKTIAGDNYLSSLKYFYNGMKDNKPWYEYYNRNQFTKLTPEINVSIKFNTEQECINFCESLKTTFGRFCTELLVVDQHIYSYSIPFMESYKEPWTDERFYKFFNFSNEEIQQIESFVKDYNKFN